MNELAIEKSVTDMQAMMHKLMEISISNTDEMKTEIKSMGTKLDTVEKRMDDFENNSELTTQQRNTVRRTVNKQVYKLLRLPERKSDWTLNDRVTAKKYSQLFHQRCYAEFLKEAICHRLMEQQFLRILFRLSEISKHGHLQMVLKG